MGLDDNQGCGRKALKSKGSVTFNCSTDFRQLEKAFALLEGLLPSCVHTTQHRIHRIIKFYEFCVGLPTELCNALPYRHHDTLTAERENEKPVQMKK